MRDIDVHELVGEMKTGWNLGNTLDSLGGETAWGNPKTTHGMIDTVAAAGFNVIRIPTTWGEKMDTENGYTISDEWIDRVHEIVDYAFDNDMYVILNTHHETTWIKPSMAEMDS
ncbi:MAG: cellulase family glycosylhydrolase, partial [Ruminiclostridium sp.]|nr:cellulase family glycosylhydrolase [Ruminiclostridium sp.]